MQAHEIMNTAHNANDAIARAETEDPCIFQDWDSETTLFRFADGSVLAVSGPQCNAYDDEDDAGEDFPGMLD